MAWCVWSKGGGDRSRFTDPETVDRPPCTLNPEPCTVNPELRALSPAPSTLNFEPGTLHQQPRTLTPDPSTLRPDLELAVLRHIDAVLHQLWADAVGPSEPHSTHLQTHMPDQTTRTVISL